MNYQESRTYINNSAQYGTVLGLTTMQELMRRLGSPQNELKFIHVAGTNGKGSVIAYLYSTLTQSGYRTGRYISPTLYSYRERMEVSGNLISREKFAVYLTQVAQAIEEMTAEGMPHPTPFEIETAVAFLFFKDENCDLVLLEVGMGGSLDATNIVSTTILSILVSISMDHMSFLGNTLAEIAETKAGIIKPGARMVTTRQRPEAEKVIRSVCQKMDVPYEMSDPDAAHILREDLEGQTFTCEGEEYEISLSGTYQKENALLALKALEILDGCGYPTTLQQRKQGLCSAKWNGRFTILHKEPLFIVDGAHNPAAADKMADSIRRYFDGKTIYYIMGMFRDKDYESVIQKTAGFAEKIITIAAPDNPRALPAEDLARAVRKYHKDAEAAKSLSDAVTQAFALAGPEDVILAFGSLAFIGDLTRIVKEREDNHND